MNNTKHIYQGGDSMIKFIKHYGVYVCEITFILMLSAFVYFLLIAF